MKAMAAKQVVSAKKIGKIRHICGHMASPLTALFDNPANTGWVSPQKGMLGNGFAWGQSCVSSSSLNHFHMYSFFLSAAQFIPSFRSTLAFSRVGSIGL
jgi:hypothetical protein